MSKSRLCGIRRTLEDPERKVHENLLNLKSRSVFDRESREALQGSFLGPGRDATKQFQLQYPVLLIMGETHTPKGCEESNMPDGDLLVHVKTRDLCTEKLISSS